MAGSAQLQDGGGRRQEGHAGERQPVPDLRYELAGEEKNSRKFRIPRERNVSRARSAIRRLISPADAPRAWSHAEDHRAVRAEPSAGAAHARQPGAGNLALAAFAAQLAGRLDE